MPEDHGACFAYMQVKSLYGTPGSLDATCMDASIGDPKTLLCFAEQSLFHGSLRVSAIVLKGQNLILHKKPLVQRLLEVRGNPRKDNILKLPFCMGLCDK